MPVARGQSSRNAGSVAAALAPSRQGLDDYDELEVQQVMQMRGMYQFYSVTHFCRVFRTTLDLPHFKPAQLERALVQPRTSPMLPEIVCRLLFGRRPSNRNELMRQREHWEAELKVWLDGIGYFKDDKTGVAEVGAEDGGAAEDGVDFDNLEYDEEGLYVPFEEWEDGPNPLSSGGFFAVEPAMRLKILRELLEARVFEDTYIREVSELEFEGVDPHGGPIGSDSEGYYYYHDGGKSPRIYREKPKKSQKGQGGPMPDAPLSWDTITTCLDEIEALLKYHQKSRKVADRELCAHLEEHIIPPLRAARDAEERREIREENRLKRKAEMEERRKVWDAMPKKRSSRLERLEMERRAQEDERERIEEEKRRLAEEKRKMLEEKSEQAPLLVDRRVRVLWEEDNTWYSGLVTEYDKNTGEHTLFYYDDSSSERLDLWASDVKWEHDTTPLPAEYVANEANALPIEGQEDVAPPAIVGGAAGRVPVEAKEERKDSAAPPKISATGDAEIGTVDEHETKRQRIENSSVDAVSMEIDNAPGAVVVADIEKRGRKDEVAGGVNIASHSETKTAPQSDSQSGPDRIRGADPAVAIPPAPTSVKAQSTFPVLGNGVGTGETVETDKAPSLERGHNETKSVGSAEIVNGSSALRPAVAQLSNGAPQLDASHPSEVAMLDNGKCGDAANLVLSPANGGHENGDNHVQHGGLPLAM